MKRVAEGKRQDPIVRRECVTDRNAPWIRADGKWKSRGNALIKDKSSVRKIDNQLVERFAGVAGKSDREKGGTARAVIGGISVRDYLHGGGFMGRRRCTNIWIEIVREDGLFHQRSNLIGRARTRPTGCLENQRANSGGRWNCGTCAQEVRE